MSLVETKIDLKEIEESIKNLGWYYFGNKEFKCPGFRKENREFYLKNNKLPSPCDKCFKALIFWKEEYSKENLKNFFNMIGSFETNYLGKLNKDVVVFYFRNRIKMLEFLKFLENKMKEYNVLGKIEWRRACKEYQKLKPELWRNAKEFIPDIIKV
jgi:hypothetical protein